MQRTFTADRTLESCIGLIREAVALLKENDASPRSLFIGELVLEEILTNIVKYAYEDTLPHQIEVQVRLSDGHVGLVFRDDGVPFDPLLAPPPEAGLPLAARRLGGRGIHLVRSFVKEMGYRREDGWNVLTLVFPVKAA